MKRLAFAIALMFGASALPTQAAEDASCQAVRMADVGWTDITATTTVASELLKGLNYKPQVSIVTLPIAFTGLKTKKIDVFLGYWKPSMDPVIGPFIEEKSLTVLEPNLTGAKYTLAVPTYAADAGLKTFADIAKFKDQLEGKIYAIEPGNDGNALIIKMIKDNAFGLKDFKIVESSEAGMLIEVERAIKKNKPIVFLGWEPHPMNIRNKMTYLTGGDEFFGPNLGEAQVITTTANDYITKCPNVGKFVSNLKFTTDIENQLMVPILDKKAPEKVIREWLKGNPDTVAKWLDGVQTFDGQPGLAAVTAHLAK
jgi:glycine betaine/proline transport system substrate-binding protein